MRFNLTECQQRECPCCQVSLNGEAGQVRPTCYSYVYESLFPGVSQQGSLLLPHTAPHATPEVQCQRAMIYPKVGIGASLHLLPLEHSVLREGS